MELGLAGLRGGLNCRLAVDPFICEPVKLPCLPAPSRPLIHPARPTPPAAPPAPRQCPHASRCSQPPAPRPPCTRWRRCRGPRGPRCPAKGRARTSRAQCRDEWLNGQMGLLHLLHAGCLADPAHRCSLGAVGCAHLHRSTVSGDMSGALHVHLPHGHNISAQRWLVMMLALGAVVRSNASTPLTLAYAPVGACPASRSARSTWRSSLLLPAGGGVGLAAGGGS